MTADINFTVWKASSITDHGQNNVLFSKLISHCKILTYECTSQAIPEIKKWSTITRTCKFE